MTRQEAPQPPPRWLTVWLFLGESNPWVKEAWDPPFNERSFYRCRDVAELLDKFEQGNWCLGQAYWLGELCFIQQVDGGDEWLTIKRNLAFESISWGHILRQHGREYARGYMRDLQFAPLKDCQGLNYRGFGREGC